MSKQILIEDPVALRNMWTFAVNNGCQAEFAESFMRLLSFVTAGMIEDTHGKEGSKQETRFAATEGDQVAVISKDFAPFSLRFFVTNGTASSPREWHRREGFSNGGFIYEGPGCPSDGSAPSLSVSLTPSTKKHSWNIHT